MDGYCRPQAPRPEGVSGTKALSVRQPWAELILAGRKNYELRTWWTAYRGRVWIHAGRCVERAFLDRASLDAVRLPTGAIVGSVEIAACDPFTLQIADEMRTTGSWFGSWQPAMFAWELRDVRRLAEPIPWQGVLASTSAIFDRGHKIQIRGCDDFPG